MAGFYAVYHGPDGLKEIAKRIHSLTNCLNKQLTKLGYVQKNELFFDTLRLQLPENVSTQKLQTIAMSKKANLRYFDNGDVGVSIDEATTLADINHLLNIFGIAAETSIQEITDVPEMSSLTRELRRRTGFLSHEVFNKYHTETEMMRYINGWNAKTSP